MWTRSLNGAPLLARSMKAFANNGLASCSTMPAKNSNASNARLDRCGRRYVATNSRVDLSGTRRSCVQHETDKGSVLSRRPGGAGLRAGYRILCVTVAGAWTKRVVITRPPGRDEAPTLGHPVDQRKR